MPIYSATVEATITVTIKDGSGNEVSHYNDGRKFVMRNEYGNDVEPTEVVDHAMSRWAIEMGKNALNDILDKQFDVVNPAEGP